jgi:heavy metal efflux system protein
MIESLIRFSVQNKLIIGILTLGLIGAGIFSLQQLPIDAVPDITNNQVQIVTVSPSLAPQEVEQFITYPVEVAMANIPNVIEIRSISRFGLSVITVVFEDYVPILEARQFVKEQIGQAEQGIPPGLGKPELMPITTGLGEIYQYVLEVQPGYEHQYDAMRLRTIQDWIVKRQLAGIPGIIEVSSFGGYLKQYEVGLDPVLLQSYDISIAEVFDALARNNQNSGGSYIEKNTNAYYIRTEGIVKSISDIEHIVIANQGGVPVLVRDVGQVQFGSPKRFGAMTMDGKGEAVGGITLMFKGANSSAAIKNVRERVELVKKSLPEGLDIYPYLDRSVLVEKTSNTVKKNLLEGGLIVIVVLILLLGDLRAGLIVASVIPLAMLFAVILMNYFGVSANLMSLGAIDFGIVVDGAVIVVEGMMHTLFTYYVGRKLTQLEMDRIITESSAKLFRAAVFGVFIILVVFIPIMTLTGIEGKMFRPMALTFSFAILGALILSLTYVPAMAAFILPKQIKAHKSFADRIIIFLRRMYRPTLKLALRFPAMVISLAVAFMVGALLLFRTMGSEFIPTLEEGDLAMQMAIQPGSSLSESINTSTKAERILLENFPEVRHVVSKIGTAEVPTDPMAVEDADIMIILDEKENWTSARTREELVEKMKDALEVIPGATFEFTQPIQLRFNELMTGAKTDIAVKIFGEDTEVLKEYADRAASIIDDIRGAGDVKVEQTEGLPQLKVEFNRDKIAEYGMNIEDLNALVRTAYAGEVAGVVFENERKFDLVVRLTAPYRDELNLNRLFVHMDDGRAVPLSEVAVAEYSEGPMQISREDARRRINIGVNVRNRDVAGLVADIEQALDQRLELPPGYYIRYGGQFENLEAARKRLSVAVPVALLLIFVLLFFTFGKLKYALMIITAVPMSAIGGVVALWLRDMPFSISAGVGFIALFGVAVLNGIVLISYFNRLRYEDGMTDIKEVVIEGGCVRLRPVIMTATVAALGFLPMALSISNGAEVQKPLATVVIGGLITATLLTLILMPILYHLVNRNIKRPGIGSAAAIAVLLLLATVKTQAQPQSLSLDVAVQSAMQQHPNLQNAALEVQAAALQLEGARQIPATQFNLDIGQISTNLVDYNFSAVQGFGNWAADRRRKEVAKARIALAERNQDLAGHELAAMVKSAWYEWFYQTHREALLEEQLALIDSVRSRALIQFEAGEIDRLELTLAENQWTQAQRGLTETRREREQAYALLRQSAFLTGEYAPPPGELEALPLPVSNQLDGRLAAPQQQQVTVAQQETGLQEKQLLPEFSAGYFNQSIRPDFSFQGVTLGMSLPIWRKFQKTEIERARLRETVAANELRGRQNLLENSLATARRQATLLFEELQENGSRQQEQARSLRSLAETQLKNGEIDYFRYIQSIEAALRNDLQYIDLLNRYNQAVLFLEYLTN